MKTNNYGKVSFDSGKSTFQQGTYTVLHLSLQSWKSIQTNKQYCEVMVVMN
jgi:hypothetical protein